MTRLRASGASANRGRWFLWVWLVLLSVAPVAAQPAETVEYYGQDMIGSIRIVFAANGTVLGRQDYEPFGRRLFAVPALPKERFGSEERDDEINQAYFHARMYSEGTGRLTRPDPITGQKDNPQTSNRYAYALNSPVSWSDFSGLVATPSECPPDAPCEEPKVPKPPRGPDDDDDGCIPYPTISVSIGAGNWGDDDGDGGGGGDDGDDGDGGGQGPPTGGPPGPPPPGPPTFTEVCLAMASGFIQGAGAGFLGFADDVVPFADPLAGAGAYNPAGAGVKYSVEIGSFVRNFAVTSMYSFGTAANVAWQAEVGAASGSRLWALARSNRVARIGLGKMGGAYRVPALRIGNLEAGKGLTHVNLSGQLFSKPTLKFAKKCMQVLK